MKTIRCLFWNINYKNSPFENIIRDISKEIDILILAEAENIDYTIVENLTKLKHIKSISALDHGALTPAIFSSENGFNLTHINTAISKRLIFYNLSCPGAQDLLLCGIHFPSKLEYNTETQEEIANAYIGWINEIEEGLNTKRTIVVGDFNMNPFELGMIKPKTFNATLSKEMAKTSPRTFHYGKYDFFYNPMWNFMGDHRFSSSTPKLPGSYYFYSTTDVKIIYWNVFENVLLRPDVIDNIDLSTLAIPTNVGGHQLADANYEIDLVNYSDHLPLIFNLIF